MLLNNDTLLFVFDCESIGLHGETYAVGYVVKRGDGEHLADGCLACSPALASGTAEDRAWIEANVPPIDINCARPIHVRAAFWQIWLEWKEKGALMFADCAWPVEARFLADCVDDDPDKRRWAGPYPLHDVGTFLLANGLDPLATYDRRPEELPAHHPTNDALQSARLVLDILSRKAPQGSGDQSTPGLLAAAKDVDAFLGVMFGDENGVVPATISTPLGVPVKLGAIVADLRAALLAAKPDDTSWMDQPRFGGEGAEGTAS